MKKIYLNMLRYPKFDTYSLANEFGDRLCDYLGKDLFCLLLDSKLLLGLKPKKYYCINNSSYMIHPASMVLEAFLNKLIKGKDLKENKQDTIGGVFGSQSKITSKKIRNKQLIPKILSTWNFCRNVVAHYPDCQTITFLNANKKYEEILKSSNLHLQIFMASQI